MQTGQPKHHKSPQVNAHHYKSVSVTHTTEVQFTLLLILSLHDNQTGWKNNYHWHRNDIEIISNTHLYAVKFLWLKLDKSSRTSKIYSEFAVTIISI